MPPPSGSPFRILTLGPGGLPDDAFQLNAWAATARRNVDVLAASLAAYPLRDGVGVVVKTYSEVPGVHGIAVRKAGAEVVATATCVPLGGGLYDAGMGGYRVADSATATGRYRAIIRPWRERFERLWVAGPVVYPPPGPG